jgi:uncharacterized protein
MILYSLVESAAKKMAIFSSFAIPMVAIEVAYANTTASGIALNNEWKQKIYAYAEDNIKHSAWGIAHSERDYQLSLALAKQEKIAVDEEVIFCAAFLHDIGAVDPFFQKDVEHSANSVKIIKPLLESWNFPMEKWPKVEAIILGHMFYAQRPQEPEAIVFHDADVLDFLGSIGIARIISVTGRHRWAPDLPQAIVTLQKFRDTLTDKLITKSAREIAVSRITEMNRFFSSLSKESLDNKAL